MQDAPDSLEPTPLDEARIEDLDVGDRMDSESGDFFVGRYRDSYNLIINQRNNHKDLNFPSAAAVLEYLRSCD